MGDCACGVGSVWLIATAWVFQAGQATLGYAPLGELDEQQVEEVAGVVEDPDAELRMSTLDRKFLRSLKIAVDEE